MVAFPAWPVGCSSGFTSLRPIRDGLRPSAAPERESRTDERQRGRLLSRFVSGRDQVSSPLTPPNPFSCVPADRRRRAPAVARSIAFLCVFGYAATRVAECLPDTRVSGYPILLPCPVLLDGLSARVLSQGGVQSIATEPRIDELGCQAAAVGFLAFCNRRQTEIQMVGQEECRLGSSIGPYGFPVRRFCGRAMTTRLLAALVGMVVRHLQKTSGRRDKGPPTAGIAGTVSSSASRTPRLCSHPDVRIMVRPHGWSSGCGTGGSSGCPLPAYPDT